MMDSAIALSSLPGYGLPLKKLKDLMNEATTNMDKQFVGQMLLTVVANVDETDILRDIMRDN